MAFGFCTGVLLGVWNFRIVRLKRALELTVARQQTRLQDITAFAPVGIFQFTPDGRYVDVNNRYASMLGYEREDLLAGRVNMADLYQVPEDYEEVGRSLAEGRELVDHHVALRRKDGSPMWMSVFVKIAREAEGFYYDGFALDITDRKHGEEQLRHMAVTDELTGLVNRRCFVESARKEIERCRRFGHDLAFIMIDADRFKNVNDNYGHGVGDDVLRMIASTTAESLRAVDVLARIGGEEFAVLLPQTGPDGAALVAERIRKGIEDQSVACARGEVRITVSLGLAMLARDMKQLEDLMKAGDEALYRAKANGRNRVEVHVSS